MVNCIVVGLGGFVGSVLRYLIGLIPVNEAFGFPVSTLLINILGAFAIGLIAGSFPGSSNVNPMMLLFLKVGLCGGFTTFSTFSLETSALIQSGRLPAAILYVFLSMTLSVCAVFASDFLS